MEMTETRLLAIVAGVILIVLAIVIPTSCVTTVHADEIVVHQDISGELTVWTEPGWKYKGLGAITTYKRSAQFDFTTADAAHKAKSEEEKKVVGHDNSIGVRFNDQGEAKMSGSVSYDLPLSHEALLKLHKKFGSMAAIEDRLVKRTVERAVYFSGPLMSSRESAGERRAELIHFIIEQATRGVYKTESKTSEIDDLLAPPVEVVELVPTPVMDEETGKPKLDDNGKPVLAQEPKKVMRPAKKQITITQPKLGKGGVIEVQESSALTDFNIKLYNLTVNAIIYDANVKKQIDMQRQAIMDIQTKIAEAKAAEQRALTVEKEGQANAAKAKWDQEVKKSQAITKAEQAKAVAVLQAEKTRAVAEKDLEAAKLERLATVERAKGEARARKLAMESDGSLDKKLAAWKDVQIAWAQAMSKQRLVPEVQMGGGSGAASPQMMLMQALGIKAMKDLSLDMKPGGGAK